MTFSVFERREGGRKRELAYSVVAGEEEDWYPAMGARCQGINCRFERIRTAGNLWEGPWIS